MLPLLLGLLIVGAQGALKECPVSDAGVKTSYTDYYGYGSSYVTGRELLTTGPSACSLLGTEPFDGDVPFAIAVYGGSSVTNLSDARLSKIEATIGDILVSFDSKPNAASSAVQVANISIDNISTIGSLVRGAISVTNATLTQHPLALATSVNSSLPPAPGRRLQQAAPSPAPSARLLGSDHTDRLCDLSKAYCSATVKAAEALGPLCPAAESDRLAVAASVMQTCAGAVQNCTSQEPLDRVGCGTRQSICYTRLAQLLTCGVAKRCEGALQAGDRSQLGCDEQKRDPLFSKGCTGKVHQVLSRQLRELADLHDMSLEDIRAANPGKDIASEKLICVPGRKLGCGDKLPPVRRQATPGVFRIPVDGKTSATLTWASRAQETATFRIRDQGSGTILYTTGELYRGNGTKTVSLPAGVSEIALVSVGATDGWDVSVDCS